VQLAVSVYQEYRNFRIHDFKQKEYKLCYNIDIYSVTTLFPMLHTLTPALLPLYGIVIATLSALSIIPYYIAGCMGGIAFALYRYVHGATYTTIMISACLVAISGGRLYYLVRMCATGQQHAEQSLSGHAHVCDVDPPQAYRRMATIDISTQSSGTLRCKVRIPHTWSMKPSDIVYVHAVTIPRVTNSSFCWYLMREQLAGYIHATPRMRITHRPHYSIRRYIWSIKVHLLSTIYEHLPRHHADIVSHIFLGYKATSATTRQQFERWGVSHMLARSGLHLAIFTACCAYALRYIPCSLIIRDLCILTCTLIYAMCSWMSVSFLRALHMICGMYVCRSLQIPYHAEHWVMWSALMLLCYNPLHLMFLDFQLSFLVTWALCWVFTRLVTRTHL